jgi:succinylglutamate desuccinylase
VHYDLRTTNFARRTVHYDLRTTNFARRTVHYDLHTVNFARRTVHYDLRTTNFTLRTVHYDLRTMNFTRRTVHCVLRCTLEIGTAPPLTATTNYLLPTSNFLIISNAAFVIFVPGPKMAETPDSFRKS